MLVVLSSIPFWILVSCLVFQWGSLAAWQQMWLLGFAVFFGFKTLTVFELAKAGTKFTLKRFLFYLFGWFGMDAERFFNYSRACMKPRLIEWLAGLASGLFGILLIWGITLIFPMSQRAHAGFVIAGLFYLLYFTAFQVNSLFLRSANVDAPPLMNKPFLMLSLADFWGNRWNMAFNQIMHDFFFQKVHSFRNPYMAAGLVFIMSGIFHEIIFSLPAQGGWGMPMLYFLIQWLGVYIEKTRFGRKHLRRKFLGRVYAYLVLLVPIRLLFHDPFVDNVIVPFMRVIGAH